MFLPLYQATESKEIFGKILINKYQFQQRRQSSGKRKTIWQGIKLKEELSKCIQDLEGKEIMAAA
jgi:hypothetical protein